MNLLVGRIIVKSWDWNYILSFILNFVVEEDVFIWVSVFFISFLGLCLLYLEMLFVIGNVKILVRDKKMCSVYW